MPRAAWPNLVPTLGLHAAGHHQVQLVPLDAVFAHLAPSNEDFAKAYDSAWAKMDNTASNIGVINLADVSKAPAKPAPNTGAQPLDLDARGMDAAFGAELGQHNQKVAVLVALVEVRRPTPLRQHRQPPTPYVCPARGGSIPRRGRIVPPVLGRPLRGGRCAAALGGRVGCRPRHAGAAQAARI